MCCNHKLQTGIWQTAKSSDAARRAFYLKGNRRINSNGQLEKARLHSRDPFRRDASSVPLFYFRLQSYSLQSNHEVPAVRRRRFNTLTAWERDETANVTINWIKKLADRHGESFKQGLHFLLKFVTLLTKCNTYFLLTWSTHWVSVDETEIACYDCRRSRCLHKHLITLQVLHYFQICVKVDKTQEFPCKKNLHSSYISHLVLKENTTHGSSTKKLKKDTGPAASRESSVTAGARTCRASVSGAWARASLGWQREAACRRNSIIFNRQHKETHSTLV